MIKDKKRPAPNKQFGVMRGVCSQKVLREFESLSPARTPSRQPLHANEAIVRS